MITVAIGIAVAASTGSIVSGIGAFITGELALLVIGLACWDGK